MSEGILIVAEHLRGELCEITREVVSAGKQLKGNGRLTIALIARDPSAFVAAASLEGVDEIIEVPVNASEFNADIYIEALEAIVRERKPAAVLMGFTAYGMETGPTLAVRAGLGFASDVVSCSMEGGKVLARRRFHGGKVEAELEFRDDAVLLLLRPTVWAAAPAGATPELTSFATSIDPARVRICHREFIDPPANELDISTADVIMAIGRGIGERENVQKLEALAERMGVTLAASRPLVDAGWVPKYRQVGQSGTTVKPKLYLALGISGAFQHVAGMKKSEVIVGVNADPQAPIFNVAHYGAVADLFDVVDELEKLWG